jgi:hypothetical protein
LHELEQKRQGRIPNQRAADDRDVIAERKMAGKLPVVATNGQLIGPFADGRKKLAKGRRILNRVIFPFDIHTNRRGKVTIKQNTRFYYADEAVHIRVRKATVDEDGRILVTFRETGVSFPRRSWTFMTRDLARYIEEERLKSDEEINERAEQVMAELQGGA